MVCAGVISIARQTRRKWSGLSERRPWQNKTAEEAFLPPFCHLAVIGLKSRDLRLVGAWAEMYAASLGRLGRTGLRVSEAMPSALEKADGWYRWQVVLRSKSASAIVGAWRWISSVRPPPKALRVTVDIDAVNVL